MDFLLGTALIVPGPHQLPLTLGVAAVKVAAGSGGTCVQPSLKVDLQP